MKKVLKSVLLLALLLCYNSCVDCKDSNEPQAPTVELEKEVEVKVTVTTGAFSNVNSTYAEVSGNVESMENVDSEVEIGIVYGTDTIPSIYSGQFVSSHRKEEGAYTVTLPDLKPSTTYYYRSCVIVDGKGYYGEVSSFTTKGEITSGQEVDLGLSVKWAGWNVGATSPEQYGGYYAWGETEEKSDYDLDTYKYYNSQTSEYINIGENISGTQYDVATAKWGNGWRIPTKEEMDELISKCIFDKYYYKGVKGCKVTAPNGNAIFFPLPGNLWGTLHESGFGSYWSGSLFESDSNEAWGLYFNSDGDRDMDYYNRYCGQSVRPVRDY